MNTDVLIKILIGFVLLFFIKDIVTEIIIPKNTGLTPEEVNLILDLKEKDKKIDSLKNEFLIINLKNEKIKKNISSDSLFIWGASRSYRDSLRTAINPK